ncbi:hypothetical protein [Mycobacterium cookii]|uniref:hypothetical protein n=1 Tax=Mycobacterium cookii TaxID=1775 RepID=UPI0013D3F692|nr:hypothetical protein [Mycobacterium cookii]MCV7332606.1 hypothetical protein [Mycobacterium cookii]
MSVLLIPPLAGARVTVPGYFHTTGSASAAVTAACGWLPCFMRAPEQRRPSSSSTGSARSSAYSDGVGCAI